MKIVPEALRQRLSRLAGRETRLADQPAVVVGASDSQSGMRRPSVRKISAAPLPAATTSYGSAIPITIGGSSARWKRTCPRMLYPAASWCAILTCSIPGFSSALWPHSTLGWPDKTPELAYYYPTSTLVTSRDIITLWVARMVLTGLHNVGDVPFREVFIHPKILDGYGETMSKSKGNGVDPVGHHGEVWRRRTAIRSRVSDDRDRRMCGCRWSSNVRIAVHWSSRPKRTACCRASRANSAVRNSLRNGPISRTTWRLPGRSGGE